MTERVYEYTMMTFEDLRALVDQIEHSGRNCLWVCIDGKGPVTRVVWEPGANEPFLILEHKL